MSLQFILGSGLVGYAIGALIEEEERRATFLRMGAASPEAASPIAYHEEVRKIKGEYFEVLKAYRKDAPGAREARRQAFERMNRKLRELNTRLKADKEMYGKQMEILCRILQRLDAAKRRNPNLKGGEELAAAREYLSGLVLPEEVEVVLKRCFPKGTALTAGFVKGLIPGVEIAAAPVVAPPRIPAEAHPPVPTSATARRIPSVTTPLEPSPVPTLAPREDVATPGGGEGMCGPLEVWIEGVGCVDVMSLAPTPTYGGTAQAPPPGPPSPPPSMPAFAPTPTLGRIRVLNLR